MEPGIVGALPGDWGTALISAPPGGDVGGELGTAGMPRNEKSSFPVGSVGATVRGESVPSAKKPGAEPATGVVGAVPGAPGTSAVAPANDAAIARRSDSVSGPGCEDGAEAEILGADSNKGAR